MRDLRLSHSRLKSKQIGTIMTTPARGQNQMTTNGEGNIPSREFGAS